MPKKNSDAQSSAYIPVEYRMTGFDFDGFTYHEDVHLILESPQPFSDGVARAIRIRQTLLAFMQTGLFFLELHSHREMFFASIGEALDWPAGVCRKLLNRLVEARDAFKDKNGDRIPYAGTSLSGQMEKMMMALVDEYVNLCEDTPEDPAPGRQRQLLAAIRSFIRTTPEDLPMSSPSIPTSNTVPARDKRASDDSESSDLWSSNYDSSDGDRRAIKKSKTVVRDTTPIRKTLSTPSRTRVQTVRDDNENQTPSKKSAKSTPKLHVKRTIGMRRDSATVPTSGALSRPEALVEYSENEEDELN